MTGEWFFVYTMAKKFVPSKKEGRIRTPNSKDFIEIDGEILEALPAGSFKVELESGHKILAHLSGKMRMFNIRILPGDKVKIEMTPYDLTRGRITYRY